MAAPINNIDLFNASTALILSTLYKNVPVPTTLNYSNLSSSIFIDTGSATPEKKLDVFINTVTWLKKSGFIWLDTEGEQDVFGALLSPKGLQALSIIPDDSADNKTIGSLLSEAEENNTLEKISTLINTVLKAGSGIL